MLIYICIRRIFYVIQQKCYKRNSQIIWNQNIKLHSQWKHLIYSIYPDESLAWVLPWKISSSTVTKSNSASECFWGLPSCPLQNKQFIYILFYLLYNHNIVYLANSPGKTELSIMLTTVLSKLHNTPNACNKSCLIDHLTSIW